MATNEFREKLLALPLLSGFPEETKARICTVIEGVSEETVAAAGEDLLHEGHLALASGYILLEGAVHVEREGFETVELEAPRLLGEMSQFIHDDSRVATVKIARDARFLKFSWDDLYKSADGKLSKKEKAAFVHAIEKIVWERYEIPEILNLAMLEELSDDLKVRICLPFPWIGKRRHIANDESLFKADENCKGQGFLLLKGKITLNWPGGEERFVVAPNILGIMPNNKPDRVWSASARGNGEAEILAFKWPDYGERLEERLSGNEMKLFFDALKKNGKRHFWN